MSKASHPASPAVSPAMELSCRCRLGLRAPWRRVARVLRWPATGPRSDLGLTWDSRPSRLMVMCSSSLTVWRSVRRGW